MRAKIKPDLRSPRNRRRSGTGLLEMGFLMMPFFALIGGFIFKLVVGDTGSNALMLIVSGIFFLIAAA